MSVNPFKWKHYEGEIMVPLQKIWRFYKITENLHKWKS